MAKHYVCDALTKPMKATY